MFESIGELLRYRARMNPKRIALIFQEQETTYLELFERALGAAKLLKEHGLQKGERFGVLDFNGPGVVDLVHGAALLGCVPVLLNWRLSRDEIEFILRDAGCRCLFRGGEFAAMEPAGVRIIEVESTTRSPGLAPGDVGTPAVPARDEDLMQLYTSGTTGRPRGVRTTHANMLALLEQLLLEVPGINGETRNLVCAPFFHIAGIGYWLFGLMAGVTNILLNRFEPAATAMVMENRRVSHALLVPAMQQAVLDYLDTQSQPEASGRFASLRHILYGASPISESLLKRSARIFQCDYTQAYGLTETTGVVSLLTADDHRAVLAARDGDARGLVQSAGRPAPGMEIRIAREDGTFADVGESGEVEVQGPVVMPAYWNRERENAETFRGDWLRTGDVGYLDEDGYLYLRDRKKDLIISGGEKVYPIEVERVLMSHARVRDAAVVGVPDEKFGESVCAFIVGDFQVSNEGSGDANDEAKAALTRELREWIGPLVPAYRVPRVWRFVTELPRNPSGKVLRRELRAPFWENRDRVIA